MSVKYTTSIGKELTLKPVSQMLINKALTAVRQRYEKEGLLKKPTYTVKTASGDVQIFEHDETTITTKEEKIEWDNYQANLEKLADEERLTSVKLLLLLGIDIELPEDDSWTKKHKLFGIDIPEDEMDRLQYYIETEVLITPEDVMKVTTKIMELSTQGLDMKEVDTIQDMFHDTVDGSSSKKLEAKSG